MFDDEQYISLEMVSARVNLSERFIREKTKAGKIPHLIVGGRLRFQVKSVRAALKDMEQGGGGK